MKIIITMGLLSFLFSGCNALDVTEIQQGRHLEKAIETGVQDFFDKRMTNRPRKANVGSWMILHETSDWVYFGYPKFKILFSDAREIDTLFKTNKNVLSEQFPNYKTFEGNDVRLRVMDYIGVFLKSSGETLPGFAWDWIAKLETGALEITAPCTVRSGEKEIKKTFYLRLNKNDLTLIDIKDEE